LRNKAGLLENKAGLFFKERRNIKFPVLLGGTGFFVYFCSGITKTIEEVNYEELVEKRNALKTNRVQMPFGYFYKRQIDGKYSNFVEFHDELADNILFSDCVKKDSEASATLGDRRQLRFTPNTGEEGSDGIYAVAVEPGNYQTIGQLLDETPAVVAQKGFVENAVDDLAKLLTALNEKGIQQICLAPSNVLVRKNDNSVRLLLHGSFYQKLGMNAELYDGVEEFVAPEVMRGEPATDRSDVYALAKFMEYLYASSGLPIEQKMVVKKALSEDPEARYTTVDEFAKAVAQRKAAMRSALMGIGAIVVALIVVGLYFTVTPNTEAVEFVKPVEEQVTDELLDEGFDPTTEFGAAADSAAIAAAIKDFQMKDSDKVDEKKLREFEAKGEQIFRKQFTQEADRILSKIYNNDRMNNNQKNFEAASDKVMEELVKKQQELGEHSALSNEKTQRIASEIIEQITERKKAELGEKPNYGIQK